MNVVRSYVTMFIFYHHVGDKSPFCFKEKDTRSQRVTNKSHEAWECLSKDDGTVYCTHCNCKAVLSEVCSHLAAILLKIEMA